MKKLKESHYNYFLSLADDNIVGYNFLYRTMLLFSKEEYLRIQEIFKLMINDPLSLPEDDPIFEVLINFKFLISNNFDELEYFKFGYFQSLHKSALITMLLPTLNCNFDCPYCFEYKQNVTISEETINQYLNWVANRLSNKTHFHITWFGGEPLLAFSKMQYISEKAQALCADRKCTYSASITTNGYLLNDDVIKALDEMKINNVHITLDGPAQTHNRLRQTKTGVPTYAQILGNIESWCSLSRSHLPLSIRINVTDDNIASIPDMFNDFSDNAKRRTRIYFRYVWSNEVSNHQMFASKSRDKDSFVPLAQLYSNAAKAGFHIDNTIDEISFSYCEVDLANHFSIDPRGYIYLCGHTFKPDEAIGHVSRDFDEDQLSHYCSWMNMNPFNDEECLKCIILPLCKGGCRKSRFYGNRGCLEEKESVDLYVGNLYDKWLRMQNEEHQIERR